MLIIKIGGITIQKNHEVRVDPDQIVEVHLNIKDQKSTGN
jgi:hypothetical protein